MKKYILSGATFTILGLVAAPLNAQTQTTASSTNASYVQTSKLIGTKVKTQQGEEVGVVKDVVLDRSNGCLAYTVLSAGGTGTRVTRQAKLVAVPWSVYSVAPDMSYLTVSVDRDRIYNAPVFEYSRMGDVSFTSSVYSAFGVSAGAGVSTSTTAGATTTTGATTQAQAGAEASAASATSPGVSASPAPATTASATAMPSATVSAAGNAPAESVSPTETRRATPERTTRPKASATASSSRRRNETSSPKAEASESDGTESSATERKTSSKKHPKEGTTEPSSTPEQR